MEATPTCELTLHSPAKVNLMLSVHGLRSDGFHNLTSLVAPLDFGDTLGISRHGTADSLACSHPDLPCDESNLILQAARRFRERLGRPVFFRFVLEKRIPVGAGLGGGSGNAATALSGMNQLCGAPFDADELRAIAAELGSDCPLFIDPVPSIMRGRGEILETPPARLAASLKGLRLLLFKPHFPIATAWAYSELVLQGSKAYESAQAADHRLAEAATPEALLANAFEPVVGRKYRALETLLARLRGAGHACLMSGSGSCCFALRPDSKESLANLKETVRDAWGRSVFWVETSISGADSMLGGGLQSAGS